MNALPSGIENFVERCGWSDARIEPLTGDASFRRYFRLRRSGGETAMVMHAPAPHEDPTPFLHVAHWLADNGMRAPEILGEDREGGWVLLEDFGDVRMREWLDDNPDEEHGAYREAIDALVRLHRLPPGPFPAYDMDAYLREALLFTQWYCPAMSLAVDEPDFEEAWREVLGPLLVRQEPGVTVLRDYHAENIMLPPGGGQGLIDFQDALVGHPAYDVVSLLQDARRDVAPSLEREMLDHYLARTGSPAAFEADYAVLGAQRNAKIVGIFTRLWKRDGKPRYLGLIPRVWEAMERDLAHEALAPVARWFDENIPGEIRDDRGGNPR